MSQNYLFNLNTKNTPKIISKNTTTPLTLYYFLFTDTSPEKPVNSSDTIFKTDPEDSETFRGISNRYMSNSTFTGYTTDIITYISSRTKSKDPDFPNAMYNEVLTIISEPYLGNIVQAVANYIDSGSGFDTQVPFNNFRITAASGKFAGYNNIRIEYTNEGLFTRKMIFS